MRFELWASDTSHPQYEFLFFLCHGPPPAFLVDALVARTLPHLAGDARLGLEMFHFAA
jgi:hypothetical protein